MKNRLDILGSILIFLLSWIAQSIFSWSGFPSIILLVSIYLIIYVPRFISPGMLFIVGIALDIITLMPFGVHSAMLLFVSYLVFVSRKKLLVMLNVKQIFMVVLFSSIYQLIELGLRYIFYKHTPTLVDACVLLITGIIWFTILQFKKR